MESDSSGTFGDSAAAHLILYVSDQAASTSFYRNVLGIHPRLDVPGMTEFVLPGGAILGLMPESGIRRLLGPSLPDPALGRGIPRAELYLLVAKPNELHRRAVEAGAIELAPMTARDWGHTVAYAIDADGHVLAFAQMTPPSSPTT